MDFLRQWAISLIICGIGATLISLLSPRGTMEKTLRAVIGIFVVSAVCLPLAKLKNADEILPAFVFENDANYSRNLEDQMLDACKDTVGKVIEETAKEMKITEYDVDADMQINENYCIIIQHIHVKVYACNSVVSAEFEGLLQNKLGVPVSVECG